jgi:hypothetical protein
VLEVCLAHMLLQKRSTVWSVRCAFREREQDTHEIYGSHPYTSLSTLQIMARVLEQ